MKEQPSVQLSKLDVAKRQLEHALRLFFSYGDIIIIHVLASNSHEILRTLCKKNGIKSVINDLIYGDVRPEKRKEFLKKINKPRNFFKHAKKDSTDTLIFDDGKNHFLLWDSCMLYTNLTNERPELLQTYLNWFYASNPNFLNNPEDIKIFKNFPSDPNNRSKFLADNLRALEYRYR